MKSSLDKFSQQVAERLFSRHPEWKGREELERSKDGAGFFSLKIAAPAMAKTEHGLLVLTKDEELTVGFDAYHAHFSEEPTVGDGYVFGVEYGLKFIDQILAEEIVAVSWWQDERWLGSAQMKAGEKPQSSSVHQGANRIRIRSWCGTHNLDRALP
jgi:hypothetical protein